MNHLSIARYFTVIV